MTTSVDELLSAYLARFDHAAAALPPGRWRDLRADVEAHLEEIRAGSTTEADVRQALDRLGPPEGIIAEEASDLPLPAPPRTAGSRALDISAVVLLLIGAFVIPLIGWVVGVVLLWASRTWTTGEKLLGTLILPGGMAAPAILALVPARSPVTSPAVGASILVLAAAAPIVIATFLLWRAERRR